MKKALITTTSTLEGWEITEYLGPVSAQFVIGSGVFADFFSGLTDFFGAHSGFYQRKLDKINNEALDQLQLKGNAIGADAVIGTRIDHDEVSGSGKSMLMVTATGTAVKAKPKNAYNKGIESRSNGAPIASEDLAILLRRRELVKLAEEDKLNLDDNTWKFLIENQVEELAPFLLNKIEQSHNPLAELGEFLDLCTEYFRHLPPEKAAKHLYGALFTSGKVTPFVIKKIREFQLMDWSSLRQLLQSDDEEVRRSALQTVSADKALYASEDIGNLETLIKDIENTFPIKGKYIEKKGRLS